jgi:hypothetical protein
VRTCFIIQPFDDDGEYDKRYDDIIVPAVRSAGLVPYRVDRDPSIEDLMKKVEQGIRDAAAVLADISLDNPNVWFEVGFAQACSKPTVLICAKDREHFPFDVGHRPITRYARQSPRDFDKLATMITARLRAALEAQLSRPGAGHEPYEGPRADLNVNELAVMTAITRRGLMVGTSILLYEVVESLKREGYSERAVEQNVNSLLSKGMLELGLPRQDIRGDTRETVSVSGRGVEWFARALARLSEERSKELTGDVLWS